MEEIWKDVVGFEGRFQVSNLGRIKRLAYICEYIQTNQYDKPKKVFQKFEEKIYKRRRKVGRNTVTIDNKDYYVYRLIAEAFIRPLKEKEEVNHIDGNKQNDCLENLEIVTRIQNQNHAYYSGINRDFKPAVRVEINGMIFESLGEAARYYNVDKCVILGKLKNDDYKPYKNKRTIPYRVKRV